MVSAGNIWSISYVKDPTYLPFNIIKGWHLNLEVKVLVFFEFVTFNRGEEFLFCRATVGDDGFQGMSGALNYWLDCGEVQVVSLEMFGEKHHMCSTSFIMLQSKLNWPTASSRHSALSASRVSEHS